MTPLTADQADLVAEYRGLAVHCARQALSRLPGVDLHELVSYADVGLCAAARTWVPAPGFKFPQWATPIIHHRIVDEYRIDHPTSRRQHKPAGLLPLDVATELAETHGSDGTLPDWAAEVIHAAASLEHGYAVVEWADVIGRLPMPARDRRIVAEVGAGHLCEDVAAAHGITPGRVSQIKARARLLCASSTGAALPERSPTTRPL